MLLFLFPSENTSSKSHPGARESGCGWSRNDKNLERGALVVRT